MDAFPAPSNPLSHGDHPPPLTSGEGESAEKKPVMKRMKDKMKKIKNSITNKTPGHGGGDSNSDNSGDNHNQQGDLDEGDEGYEESEELEQDPAFHGAPIYESSAADARIGAKETGVNEIGRGGTEGEYGRSTSGPKTGPNEIGRGTEAGYENSAAGAGTGESEWGRGETERKSAGLRGSTPEGVGVPSVPHSSSGTENKIEYGRSASGPRTGPDEIGRGTEAGYENSAAGARTGESEWGRGDTARKSAGLSGSTPELVEDFSAPNSSTGTENKIGGEEAVISPDLGSSVEAMAASSQNGGGKTQLPEDENRSNAGVIPAANERDGEERAISPELHRSFNAMSVSDQTGGGEPEVSQNKNSSYVDTISAVKDRAFSVAAESAVWGKKAASMAYEKAAGAGSAVMGQAKPEAGKDGADAVAGNQDKGVSMKDYVSGKLSPGEEDKALSQVITEALTPGKGGSPAAQSPRSPQKSGSGEGGGALGMVGKIKDTVTSFLGGGGSPRASPAAEAQAKDGSKDFIDQTPEALGHDKSAA